MEIQENSHRVLTNRAKREQKNEIKYNTLEYRVKLYLNFHIDLYDIVVASLLLLVIVKWS